MTTLAAIALPLAACSSDDGAASANGRTYAEFFVGTSAHAYQFVRVDRANPSPPSGVDKGKVCYTDRAWQPNLGRRLTEARAFRRCLRGRNGPRQRDVPVPRRGFEFAFEPVGR